MWPFSTGNSARAAFHGVNCACSTCAGVRGTRGCCGGAFPSASGALDGVAFLEPLDPSSGAPGFGAVNPMDVAGGSLGVLLANALREPYVVQKLAEVQDQCQSRAKTGVQEFLAENWPWLLLGGAALVWTNYLMLVFGVVPLVKPRVPRRVDVA